MSKKTWIKVKRGLLAPKHRDALGIRIWLYLYMIDNIDWETGKIFEWRDKDEAEDFCMPWRTLQQQRQQLEKDGYITCLQRNNRQEITVHNWTNPREYGGEKYNLKEGTDILVQEDTIKGTNKGDSKPSTPSYSPHVTSHTEELPKTPKTKKPRPKTQFVKDMERLEAVFADARGCSLPDWDNAPKASMKLWRAPLKRILKNCKGDVAFAERVVIEVTQRMRNDGLTFAYPAQIEKTAASHIIDASNPSKAARAAEVY